MKNEHDDADLDRLFLGIGEVEQDEMFVGRVSKRIALRRFARLAVKISCAIAGLIVLAGLMPLFTDLTYGIALGSNLLIRGIIAAALSPAGFAIGGGAGLLFFLRMRSEI